MKRLALAILVGASLSCTGGGTPAVNPYATAAIPSGPPPPPPYVAPDASPSLATYDAGAPSGGAPPFAIPRPEPMPVVPIADRSKDPWPKKALPPGKRLGNGGVVPPGVPSPDRVAIATTDKKGTFVDARTGALLASLPAPPEYVAPKAGVVTLEGKPPRLLRTADAKVLTPVLESSAYKPKDAWLAATRHEDRAIALAETQAGEKLVGVASDDLTKFVLEPAPFSPASKRLSATLNAREWHVTALPDSQMWGMAAGTPFVLPHEEPCVRARIEKGKPPVCIEHLPMASMGDEAHWLDDGFFSLANAIGHVGWGPRTFPIVSGAKSNMCHRRGARATPPRAVIACHTTREGFLWGPGRILTFQGPTDPNDLGGLVGADIGYVLPMPDVVRAPGADHARPTSRWLDLSGMRVLTSPPMLPLGIASFAGMEPASLASSTENKQKYVWSIDFDAATRDLVATIADCPGQLGELGEDRAHGRKRWLVLACMTPPPANSVAQNLIWAEIVDTEKKARWRTPLMPELFFADGVVVLSTRRAMSAESKTAPGELTSVDLASL